MEDSPWVRCQSRIHGRMISSTVLEVKCRSRICGAAPGVVVLHRFSTETGELLDTKRYREIVEEKR